MVTCCRYLLMINSRAFWCSSKAARSSLFSCCRVRMCLKVKFWKENFQTSPREASQVGSFFHYNFYFGQNDEAYSLNWLICIKEMEMSWLILCERLHTSVPDKDIASFNVETCTVELVNESHLNGVNDYILIWLMFHVLYKPIRYWIISCEFAYVCAWHAKSNTPWSFLLTTDSFTSKWQI